MRSFMLKLIAASIAVVGLPTIVLADVASEVIAITKAQWAAQMASDVAAAMANVADDYTEFSPGVPTRGSAAWLRT